MRSKKLKANKIKGSLQGCSVKTVYVPKEKVKAYKKLFTKKITGNTVKITIKPIR